MQTAQFKGTPVLTYPQKEEIYISQCCNVPLSIWHIQDNYGSGSAYLSALSNFQGAVNKLAQFAVVNFLVADDAFDKDDPPTNPFNWYEVSKVELAKFNLLTPEGYVRRATLILGKAGVVLSVLELQRGEDLTQHANKVQELLQLLIHT